MQIAEFQVVTNSFKLLKKVELGEVFIIFFADFC